MDELRRKVNTLLDGVQQRDVLVELLIDVIARGLGRLGGRPKRGDMTQVEFDVTKPVTKVRNGHSVSGSESGICLSLSGSDPESSQPIGEISERDDGAEPAGFLEFWALYPKKAAKVAARRAWRRARPPITKVREALAWQKQTPWWLAGNAPHPATWIKGGRWGDEPPPARPQMSERERRSHSAGEAFLAMKLPEVTNGRK